MEFIEVEVLNWSKHQPRKDIKHPNWFALSNRIFEDAKLFDLSSDEWRVLLYIFCQASQQNSEHVKIHPGHADRIAQIKPKVLSSALDKLAYAHVTRTVRPRTETSRDTTIHYNTEQYTLAQTEFERAYLGYPRKEGKARGLKIAKREIKTPGELEDLLLAVKKYSDHVKNEGTEKRYVKHFATFMGEWRDWLDPEHGSGKDFSAAGKDDSYLEEIFAKGANQ